MATLILKSFLCRVFLLLLFLNPLLVKAANLPDPVSLLPANDPAFSRVSLLRLAKSQALVNDFVGFCHTLGQISPIAKEIQPIYSYHQGLCALKSQNVERFLSVLKTTNSNLVQSELTSQLLASYQMVWPVEKMAAKDLLWLLDSFPKLRADAGFLNYYAPLAPGLSEKILYYAWYYSSLSQAKAQAIQAYQQKMLFEGKAEVWVGYFANRAARGRCGEVFGQALFIREALENRGLDSDKILEAWLDCATKLKKYTAIIGLLEDKTVEKFFKKSPEQALPALLGAYLGKNNIADAEALVRKPPFVAADSKVAGALRLQLARFYYYYKQNYELALKNFNLAAPFPKDEDDLEQMQWERLFSAYKTKDHRIAQAVYAWYHSHSFATKEYAAHLCYWFYGPMQDWFGLRAGEPTKELKKCYQLYPYQYYGILAAHEADWPAMQAHFAETDDLKTLKPPSLDKLELIEWVKVLAEFGENSLAEGFLTESFRASPDLGYLQSIAQSFSPLGYFYLSQNLFFLAYKNGPSSDGIPKRLWLKNAYPLVYTEDLRHAARITGLPPELILAIMRTESHFNPKARSPVGAMGLMQLMPDTGHHASKAFNQPTPPDLFNPSVNIVLGSDYLKGLLLRFDGNLVYAIASYNAGPQNVDKWPKPTNNTFSEEFIESIPFGETRRYVKKVLRDYLYYQLLYGHEF